MVLPNCTEGCYRSTSELKENILFKSGDKLFSIHNLYLYIRKYAKEGNRATYISYNTTESVDNNLSDHNRIY